MDPNLDENTIGKAVSLTFEFHDYLKLSMCHSSPFYRIFTETGLINRLFVSLSAFCYANMSLVYSQ